MPTFDILLEWHYSNPHDLTEIRTLWGAARQEFSTLIGTSPDLFNIGSPSDPASGIYTSLQDYIDNNYSSFADFFLNQANTFLDDIYTLGDLVYVDQNTDDEIQTKQDANANLTALSAVTMSSNQMLYCTGGSSFGSFSSTSYGRGLMNTASQAALQTAVGVSTAGLSGAYADLTGKPTLFSGAYSALTGIPTFATVATTGVYSDLSGRPSLATVATSGAYTDLTGKPTLATVATSGAYSDLTGKPTIPVTTRTSSALTGSLVTSTSAGGTQLSTTKDATVMATVSVSTTVNVASATAAVSSVIAEICATNSTTAGDWSTVATLDNEQTVSLAIALGLVAVNKGQLVFDVPAGYYYRLRSAGTGTHTETFIGGQKTIYG